MTHWFDTKDVDVETIVLTTRIARDKNDSPVIRRDGEMQPPFKGDIQEITRYRKALIQKVNWITEWLNDAKAELVKRAEAGLEEIDKLRELPEGNEPEPEEAEETGV